MSITREQFEKGLDSTDEAVLSVLREHADQAFTVSELMERTGQIGSSSLLFAHRLLLLCQRDFIVGGSISGADYVAIKSDHAQS